LEAGSCGSGELFFASAFLFAASPSCEGGEKRTTAKNKKAEANFGQKKVRSAPTANSSQVTTQKTTL
jgi:hypothetical protein